MNRQERLRRLRELEELEREEDRAKAEEQSGVAPMLLEGVQGIKCALRRGYSYRLPPDASGKIDCIYGPRVLFLGPTDAKNYMHMWGNQTDVRKALGMPEPKPFTNALTAIPIDEAVRRAETELARLKDLRAAEKKAS